METTFNEMDSIFQRTKQALSEFMEIITPIINNSADDHERLYWHHIYEEEDHRSDRLDILLPKIKQVIANEINISDHQGEFLHLLQDISLEKFGLHNFLEHLDLSLFQFNGTEYEGKIQALRDFTYEDYQSMKGILERLNQEFKGGMQFNTSIPTDEKDGIGSSLKIAAYIHDHDHDHEHDHGHNHGHHSPAQQVTAQTMKKTLTVGSLKQNR
ncbi:IMEF encapsulin system ferritin-like cargo protein [Neobacillus sp. LXY-4]|uniref:IMEF encapsulin system ferritin-like cargo protein n=1 Tax=Neobacillus sp. LXY-4 TaxID=3379826 RepID=UPI003EDFBC84